MPKWDTIGWVDEEGVYLNPYVSYTALPRLAQDNGLPLPTERTMWKLLADRGLIRTGQDGSHRWTVVPVRVGAEPQRVVWVLPHLLRSTPQGGIPPEPVTAVTLTASL